VSFLIRRIRKLPVAVFGALRPWPPAADELAAALAYDGYAAVERLEPLSRDATTKLLVNRLGGPVSSVVSHTALDLCGGNPLLLEQVAAALRRGEDISAPTPATGSSSRTEIVLTRFAGVPKVAMHCAQAASVLGTRFRPVLAAAMAQLNDQEADTALDALCRSGLVHSETGKVAKFVHPLFRHALYDDLAAPVRTRLHARAFTILTAQGLHGEAVDHAVHADLTGDECAIRAMTSAGVAALRSGAPALATRHLLAAVHSAGSQAGHDLLLALAESLLVVGRPGEAIPVCERLRSEQELTPAHRVMVLRMLGRACSATGGHNDSAAFFEQAAELAEVHDPTATVEVLLDAALASSVSAGPAKSLPLAERAHRLATNAKKSFSDRAASVRGYLTLLSGNPHGLSEIEAGARTVEENSLTSLGDLNSSWDALSIFAMAATLTERFDDAQRAVEMLISATERIDGAETISGLAMTQAIVATRQGRLAEALSFIERASSSGNPMPAYASYAGSIHAEILHQMGRSAEAVKWCDRIEPAATARGESYALLRFWNVRGQQLLRGGRSQAASELFVRLEELSCRMGIGEPCWIPWARYAIAAHLSAYRAQDARRVISWLDRSAARLHCRYPRIAAATGRARLAEAEGDYEAAEAHFSSALAYHDEVRLPLEQAETLFGYGAFLRRRRSPVRARSLLNQAAVIAETNQAGWLLEQIREEFIAASGRRRRGREATRLTVQEQRVARLAAAGHSNKAIAGKLTLSIKTVEYHLQQVYTKLGINSRRQLITEGLHQATAVVRPALSEVLPAVRRHG
jgi:DNA-binding CsgD family transcriptional regulator